MTYRPKEPVANGNSQGSEVKKTVCQKRALEDSDGTADTLSKNKQKKRSRNPNKNFCPEQKRESSWSLSDPTAHFLAWNIQVEHYWNLMVPLVFSPTAKYIKCEQCGNPKVIDLRFPNVDRRTQIVLMHT